MITIAKTIAKMMAAVMGGGTLFWRLFGEVGVGLAVDDAPVSVLAAEEHGDSKVAGGLVCLAGNGEADVLELNDVAEVPTGLRRDALDGVCAIGELGADPIEAFADLFPSFLDGAAEAAGEGNIVGV